MYSTFQTDHSCIFIMPAVMDTKYVVRAVIKVCLIPSAAHIIQEDGSNSMTKKVCTMFDWCCICKYIMKRHLLVTILHITQFM